MINLSTSRNSLMSMQNLLTLDFLLLRCQMIDIMFVYDLLNYNIICPEILALTNFRILSYS